MSKLFDFFSRSKKNKETIYQLEEENLSLKRDIEKLKEAISPLTKLGIRTTEIKPLISPFASYLKIEIKKHNKDLPDTSYRTSAQASSSPVRNKY